jgi:hypothetical protein
VSVVAAAAAAVVGVGRRKEGRRAWGMDTGMAVVGERKAMEMAIAKGCQPEMAGMRKKTMEADVTWNGEGIAFAAEEEIVAAIGKERRVRVGVAMRQVAAAAVVVVAAAAVVVVAAAAVDVVAAAAVVVVAAAAVVVVVAAAVLAAVVSDAAVAEDQTAERETEIQGGPRG